VGRAAEKQKLKKGREEEAAHAAAPVVHGARGGYRRPKAFKSQSAKEYDKGEKGGVTCTVDGRSVEQGDNASIHQHSERRAVAQAFPGKTAAYDIRLQITAWPCSDPRNDSGCHQWLQGCAMTEGITITVVVTGDQGGYASTHGLPENSTGTLVYYSDGRVTLDGRPHRL
jgi:hypothetical protein